LYWVSHPDGPLDEPERQQPGDFPELEFPKEDQPQGLLDILAREDLEGKSDRIMSITQDEPEKGVDPPEASGGYSAPIAEDLRISITKLSTILETEALPPDQPADSTKTATEADATESPTFLANLRTFFTARPAVFNKRLSGIKGWKWPGLKLKLPFLNLPMVVPGDGSPGGTLTATSVKGA
jgi:hypothetical protein